MTSPDLKIEGGTVYDPANGIDGEVRDIWVHAGRVIEAPTNPATRAIRRIDAAGMVVMPGGIDMHCHIAGSKVNLARKMCPEQKREAAAVHRTELTRSGTLGSVPSSFATGYRYAAMGYTTAFDAAIAPLAARHVHEEFADTPCIDKGCYILMGNSHYLMQALCAGEESRLRDFVAWLLHAAKGYGAKLVNPGGIEMWKQRQAGNAADLDAVVDHFGVTPRQIIRAVSDAVDELRLPHAVHIHANHLGLPGNWSTTLETMRALEGRRGHLTHIQFHSYGGQPNDETSLHSQVMPLIDYVNEHSNLSVDVGQVLFGPTTSMTGDGPLGYLLQKIYGTKWYNADIEQESGCGIVPIEYKQKSLIHAWQWAIGLEWFLLTRDPWRVALSTDHPNGGAFWAYPEIVHLLMSADYRREILATVPTMVRETSALAGIKREYSLNEICIITRAAPARMLGLKSKGHLGTGADADVTIYDPRGNPATMFETPRYVIKSGTVLIDDGELRDVVDGKTMYIAPSFDRQLEADLAPWFERNYSIRFANYSVAEEEMSHPERIACD